MLRGLGTGWKPVPKLSTFDEIFTAMSALFLVLHCIRFFVACEELWRTLQRAAANFSLPFDCGSAAEYYTTSISSHLAKNHCGAATLAARGSQPRSLVTAALRSGTGAFARRFRLSRMQCSTVESSRTGM